MFSGDRSGYISRFIFVGYSPCYQKDYTFYKSDEELREGAEYIVEQSILMKEQCEKYGLPYYETAREREEVFQHFLRDFEIR